MKRSWKTTTLGIISAAAATLQAVKLILSGNAAAVDLPTTIAAISSGLGLIFARDNDKTSEDVGCK